MKRILIMAVAAAACGPSIRVAHDAAVPVHAGATWTWGASDAGRTFAEHHPMVDNATVRGRVERALAAELAQKGFVQSRDSAAARFLVHFHLGVEERHDTVGDNRPPCLDRGCGLDWGFWGRPETAPREIDYDAGQLMLDIVDATTRKVVWRGVLEHDFVKQDVEERQVAKSIRKLCAELPTP